MPRLKFQKEALIVLIIIVVLFIGWFLLKNTSDTKPTLSNILESIITPTPEPFGYIEIIDGCGHYYDVGTCVNMRSGPSTKYPVVAQLRTGIVFKVEGTTIPDENTDEVNKRMWYKIIFDKSIRYPERIDSDWYIAVDPTSIRQFADSGDSELSNSTKISTNKRILVDRSEGVLYAYDGDTLFMKSRVSVGLENSPTPRGKFNIYRKTPSRYMQGPIPDISDQKYDLPGVPWNLYFTKEGAVVHGAYWHNHFGYPWSHGCVNLEPKEARKLYEWAELGTSVTVQD